MIISNNNKPTLESFSQLMANTDIKLNEMAKKNKNYFKGHGGKKLEEDIFSALNECAKGTEFDGSIKLVSGAKFPDIVAHKYYGVEVKSTEKNHWTSIGSSILESTRIENVERIYLTFGKLGDPVEFLSRPYEDCLSGIAVTHYPRYQIDMRLKTGETIFDKIGVTYDELRNMEDPVAPVSAYYTGQLKAGEKLWWAKGTSEVATPPIIKFWSNIDREEKNSLISEGFVLFPEVVKGDYNQYSMWLVTEKGIINPNVRDCFSAGGQEGVIVAKKEIKMPAVYRRLKLYKDSIVNSIKSANEDVLEEYWQTELKEGKRLSQWCDIVAERANYEINSQNIREVLEAIFKA